MKMRPVPKQTLVYKLVEPVEPKSISVEDFFAGGYEGAAIDKIAWAKKKQEEEMVMNYWKVVIVFNLVLLLGFIGFLVWVI